MKTAIIAQIDELQKSYQFRINFLETERRKYCVGVWKGTQVFSKIKQKFRNRTSRLLNQNFDIPGIGMIH